jgi:membrane protease YdiL (CAAX protease family)
MESLGGDRLYSLYEYLYWFGAEFVLSFLVPLALIAFVHRGRLRDFGLGAGKVRFGLKVAAIFIAVMIPVVWIASDAEQFQLVYPHAQIVKGEWTLFFVYEAVFLLYFTGWEFLWRGYMLFGLERHLGGPVAVLVQMLPFVILHSGKPVLETFGAIVAGIALGALALRTRSFWYCVVTHWFVMFAIDLCSTLRFRSGAQGLGVEAFLRAISHF